MKRTFLILAAAALLAGCGEGEKSASKADRLIEPMDVARIEELYHITDELGDEIWPGFDTRQIPIAVNCCDRQELLAGHPDPPEGFRPFDVVETDTPRFHLMDGCTRFGPEGGGWLEEVGGVDAAYVSIIQEEQTTEDYLSLLLHECFHAYQKEYRERADGDGILLPQLDADYSAMLCLESVLLHEALAGGGDPRELATMAVAVRRERRKDLPAGMIHTENEEEYDEGTATYVQARLMRLMCERGGMKPLRPGADPCYHGFSDLHGPYGGYLEKIIPPRGMIVTYHHAKYHNGMAIGLLLDSLRPDWKLEMKEKGITQFDILERACPVKESERTRLAGKARAMFAYDSIHASQKELVDARVAEIRDYIERPGRRFRIYYSQYGQGFNWKPRFRVIEVPRELMEECEARLAIDDFDDGNRHSSPDFRPLIWTGGFERFEVCGMEFESDEVPILFRLKYFEWIDTEPEPDLADVSIAYDAREGKIYTGMTMKTDGFTMFMPKARVESSNRVVAVFPVVERGKAD